MSYLSIASKFDFQSCASLFPTHVHLVSSNSIFENKPIHWLGAPLSHPVLPSTVPHTPLLPHKCLMSECMNMGSLVISSSPYHNWKVALEQQNCAIHCPSKHAINQDTLYIHTNTLRIVTDNLFRCHWKGQRMPGFSPHGDCSPVRSCAALVAGPVGVLSTASSLWLGVSLLSPPSSPNARHPSLPEAWLLWAHIPALLSGLLLQVWGKREGLFLS